MAASGGYCCKSLFRVTKRNFLGPLMRFVCGDVRGLIVSQKTTTALGGDVAKALLRSRRLKISFCEIFGIVRFSTFAIISAQLFLAILKDWCRS
jgi:hypothetical protein